MSKQTGAFEPWIRIARTGSFKDSLGRDHSFTAQDFDEIVKNYNPAEEESPVVLGHPKDNEPAHGWVKGLKREGDVLFAQLRGLKSQFVDSVKKEAFRYVSMSLHPEKNRLRHVGFLGAVPPAITGLGPVQFQANGDLTINFSVSELGPAQTEGGLQMDEKFKEMLAELHKQLAELQAKFNALTEENNAAKEALATSKSEGEKVQAEFSAYKAEVKETGRKQRLEALTSSGKVKPAEHEHIMGMINALARADNGETVNFSSSEGVLKVSPEEAYWRELEKREPSALTHDFSAQAPAGNYQQQAQQAKHVDLSHKL